MPAIAGNGAKHVVLHLANEVVSLDSNASTVAGFLAELSIRLPPGLAVEPPLDKALDDGENVFLTSLTVTRGESEREVPPDVQVTESWHYGPEKVELVDPGQAGLVRSSARSTTWAPRSGPPPARGGAPPDAPAEGGLLPRADKRGWAVDGGDPGHARRAGQGCAAAQALQAHHHDGVYGLRAGPVSCGNNSGNTAIGLQAGYGVVAVDPDVIGLGTRLYIEDYGYAVAGDTGGAIKGNRIDLGFLTLEECYAWGRRDVKVYVLY